jgi:hypothetical protein
LRLIITITRVVLLGIVTLIATSSAYAQTITFLDMEIQPNPQVAAPGDSPYWNVRLINNNEADANFVIVGFNDGLGSTPDISVPPYDPGPFGTPFTLAANASMVLNGFFQTAVSPLAADAVYDSFADLNYDLYEDGTFTSILVSSATTSADWRLVVQASTVAATPEPGALVLCCGLGTAGIGILIRRRKRRSEQSPDVPRKAANS